MSTKTKEGDDSFKGSKDKPNSNKRGWEDKGLIWGKLIHCQDTKFRSIMAKIKII